MSYVSCKIHITQIDIVSSDFVADFHKDGHLSFQLDNGLTQIIENQGVPLGFDC